jgi:8-oxo-dGTP diphosphatase
MDSDQRPSTPQVGVGAVVFHDGAVLLVQRRNPPCANEWAIPGGKVRLGETLQQAAEREILEETGIRIKAGEPVYAFDLIEGDATGEVRWHYAIIDLQAEYLGGEIQAGDDATAAAWFRPEDLKRIPLNATTRKLLKSRFGFDDRSAMG